jgi:hypothetical protein
MKRGIAAQRIGCLALAEEWKDIWKIRDGY